MPSINRKESESNVKLAYSTNNDKPLETVFDETIQPTNNDADFYQSSENSVESLYCFYETQILNALYSDNITDAIEIRKVMFNLPFDFDDLRRRINGKIGSCFKLDEDGTV